MSNEITEIKQPKTLKEWHSYLNSEAILSSVAGQIANNINPNHLAKVVYGTMTRTPGLLKCTRDSIMFCLGECARLGLEPALGRAWFIPFRNNEKNTSECTLIIGYAGLCDLARRSGNVLSIEVHAVREGDEFEVSLGTDGTIKHIPKFPKDGSVLPEAYCYYSVAKFRDGGHHTCIMTLAEIKKIQSDSQKMNSSVWKNHFEEMAKKTVLRRAAKMWPLSIMDHSFTEAMQHNDSVEFDFSPVDSENTVENKTTADIVREAVKNKMKPKTEPKEEHAEVETIDEEISVFEQAKRKIENAKTKAELDAASKWYLPLCSSGTGEIIMDEEEELVRLFNEKFGQLKK